MEHKDKTLIGGQALRRLGSTRYTDDMDYLIMDKSTKEMFIFDRNNNIDYINANGSKFFKEIWELEKNNDIASPQSLMDLKVFGFIQHCQNFNIKKMNDYEIDMHFLVLKFGVKPKISKRYISSGELGEIEKMISEWTTKTKS